MKYSFASQSLVEIDKQLSTLPKRVILTGNDLTIADIASVARTSTSVDFTNNKNILRKIQLSYEHMLEDVKKGTPVYGTNTGYGARASRVLTEGSEEEKLSMAKKISRGIVHIDVSVGPTFNKDIVRAAMVIRINMLMKGVSAIKLSDLDIYRLMLNHHITPLVGQYGGIGASGDLAHNARVLSAARWIKGTKVVNGKGIVKDASVALKAAHIPKLDLDPKAGLALVNGDNFSTALACLLAVDTVEALLIANVLGAMMIEVLKGSTRSFHPLLDAVRPHAGQKDVARIYRFLLEGSKLAFQEGKGHMIRKPGVKVQDNYSLRAISQYYGVSFEKIKWILDTIAINANSASDNPLWVAPEFATAGERPWQWVSGGNFLAMHMAEAMDGLRKIMTHIVKLNDRHLARLVNPHDNNGLPPNLSDNKAVTHCSFKGVQIQSGMFDVYSSLLSMPVTTFFGVHEETNQDITSHALTSGILGIENLRLVRYSLAQNLLAVAQAVDLSGGPRLLSPRTRPLYNLVRQKTDYVKEERPLHEAIEKLYLSIIGGEVTRVLRKEVFKHFD